MVTSPPRQFSTTKKVTRCSSSLLAMLSAEWKRRRSPDRMVVRKPLQVPAFALWLSLGALSAQFGLAQQFAAAGASIQVAPSTVSVAAGAKRTFTATSRGPGGRSVAWTVNGHTGGGPIWGTITQYGVYTAPAIDPGMPVTVSAVSPFKATIKGNAEVTVVNPPTPALTGATYADELASWNAAGIPYIQEDSGLAWDDVARTWSPIPNWTVPSYGIGPQLYYEEQFLRPATRMAIAKQDIPLLEELAAFHLALLQWRTTTIGQMLQNAPRNAIIFIDGPANARTFAWYEPYSSTQIVVREHIQADAQYLSTAAQLLRAVAEMPAANRTARLLQFVQAFSGFLVSEQLLRVMYGTTPWSYYDNPNIPQPVVKAWKFLAQTDYRPPAPYTYQAAMTDTELWLISDSAEVLGADAAAPELGILNTNTRAQLRQAVQAGVSLMHARCHHLVAPDGADVLSAFPGDYDYHPDYAYTGDTGPTQPTTPNPKLGAAWDIEHAYRFPIIFRSLYETRIATGVTFPSLNDLVALANSYVNLAFTGNPQLPAFNNFLDGWNGWFRVGYPSIPGGYPPEQYCDSTNSPNNCLTAGAVQGWGQVAFANPNLATLIQDLINLAHDDSPQDAPFKDQHYYFVTPYSLVDGVYPWIMIWVAGDSADRLP